MAKNTIKIIVDVADAVYSLSDIPADVHDLELTIAGALRNDRICREIISNKLYVVTRDEIMDKFGHDMILSSSGATTSTSEITRGIIAYYENNPETHDELFTAYINNKIIPDIIYHLRRGKAYKLRGEKLHNTACGGRGDYAFEVTCVKRNKKWQQ